MSGRPINQTRQDAINLGLTTYVGAVHIRCGTDVRYVAGGGCIHCGRELAREQREALKYAKAHPVNDADEDALDRANEMVLVSSDEMDAIEAEAARIRHQAEIDNLM